MLNYHSMVIAAGRVRLPGTPCGIVRWLVRMMYRRSGYSPAYGVVENQIH